MSESKPWSWRAALVAVAMQALLVLWLTWPLAASVRTHLPYTRFGCRVDTLLAGWTLAWETHALVTDPSSALDANTYRPEPHALLYGPTFLGALPVFAPAYLATGNPTIALNLTFLVGLVLTAAALHVVAHRWTASHLAGVIAGLTFLATRWTLWWWLPTAPPLALLEFFPFVILVASRPLLRGRDAVLLGALIAAQGLTDVRYTTAALVLPLSVLAALRLVSPRARASGVRTAAAVALGLALLSPIYAAHGDIRRRNPAIEEQTLWTIPAGPMRLPTSLLVESAPMAVPVAVLVVVVVGALVRWGAGTRDAARSAAWRHVAFWAVAGTYFAVNAVLTAGGTLVRMPHVTFLGWIGMPLLLRASLRLGLAALMGAALLAALGFAACEEWLAARARPGARRALLRGLLFTCVAAGMLAEYRWGLPGGPRGPIPARYPLLEPPTIAPAIAAVLAATPGVTLELPAALPFHQTTTMWRSIGGWWPLVNGYAGYYPVAFPDRMALAQRLPDASALETLARDTGLAWVLVRTGDMGFSPSRWTWTDLAEHGDGALRLVAQAGTDLLFAVRSPGAARHGEEDGRGVRR